MDDMQPGQIISPSSPGGEQPIREDSATMQGDVNSPAPESPVVNEAEQIPQPAQPEPYAASPTSPALQPQATITDALPMPTINPTVDSMQPQDGGNAQSQPASDEPMQWSAAAFMNRDKHGLWYVWYGIGALLLSAIVYITTKDILSTVIMFVALAGLILFLSRKPEAQAYSVDGDALTVGQKVYYLHEFKAFSVVEEGATAEVMLHPLKRFYPMVSIYIDPAHIEDLTNYLAAYLPLEPRKADAVDTLLRRIRF